MINSLIIIQFDTSWFDLTQLYLSCLIWNTNCVVCHILESLREWFIAYHQYIREHEMVFITAVIMTEQNKSKTIIKLKTSNISPKCLSLPTWETLESCNKLKIAYKLMKVSFTCWNFVGDFPHPDCNVISAKHASEDSTTFSACTMMINK